jgi:MerR family mercuric resistance operon transcriptional regulator
MLPIRQNGTGRLSRGKLARLTGCNAETIRYYENIGVLPPPPRTAGGHRVYSEEHARRLAFVLRSRQLGFSLEQVRGLLVLADDGHDSCAEVKAMTLDHVALIRHKIADLRKMQHVLTDIAARCDDGAVPACPIIEALYGDTH